VRHTPLLLVRCLPNPCRRSCFFGRAPASCRRPSAKSRYRDGIFKTQSASRLPRICHVICRVQTILPPALFDHQEEDPVYYREYCMDKKTFSWWRPASKLLPLPRLLIGRQGCSLQEFTTPFQGRISSLIIPQGRLAARTQTNVMGIVQRASWNG
jgi:hypothetical protein